MEENARLFALLNIAMADAVICAWDAKYTFNFWRPVTAIAFAEPQLNWMSFIVTPPFPDYTSGHSTVQRRGRDCASTVLRHRRFAVSQPAPIFCRACSAAFQRVSMQRRKRQQAEYTVAFTFDRQAKMGCKRVPVSANGPLPIICSPSTIAGDSSRPTNTLPTLPRSLLSVPSLKGIDVSSKSCLDASMKIRMIGLTLAFSFFGAAVCLAADPQAGTWKLNESKSKITPGTLKNTQVVYSSMFGQVKVKSDGIDANGKPIHVEWSGKVDGKDYPVTGDPNSDDSLLHEGERADTDDNQ